MTRSVRQRDYERLLTFRTTLRRFERWSSEQAKRWGLTPAQHQLLLAIRGHSAATGPTIGDVAEHLMIRPNSAVELVDRAQDLGFIRRDRDPVDHRVVRLSLTDEGARRLERLSQAHLNELTRMSGMVDELDALL